MSIDRFISRNPLACALVVLHTLLLGVCVWIQLDGAWNDMNPTMVVGMAMYGMDAPIHWMLGSWLDMKELPGTYATALLVLGTALWFIIGTLLTLAYRGLRRTSMLRKRLTDAT
jgi:hypothetical protein